MKTILIVEDNPNQRELYTEELNDEGYSVLCASSGYEALRLAGEHHLDLVILDLKLPDMDGKQILDSLLKTHPHLPFIIHTAYGTCGGNFRPLKSNEFVCKSGNLAPLKASIEVALLKNRVYA